MHAALAILSLLAPTTLMLMAATTAARTYDRTLSPDMRSVPESRWILFSRLCGTRVVSFFAAALLLALTPQLYPPSFAMSVGFPGSERFASTYSLVTRLQAASITLLPIGMMAALSSWVVGRRRLRGILLGGITSFSLVSPFIALLVYQISTQNMVEADIPVWFAYPLWVLKQDGSRSHIDHTIPFGLIYLLIPCAAFAFFSWRVRRKEMLGEPDLKTD